MGKILTISIAAYNVEQYINKAISSCILSEEYRNLVEVIVVNDGSKDATLALAKHFQTQYPDIVKVIDKKNGGYGSTINAAVKEANGKYFKLLDADDWLDVENLEYLVKRLENTEEDMILTDFLEYYGEKENNIVNKYDLMEDCHIRIHEIKANTQFLMHGLCYKTQLLKERYIPITEHCFYTDMEYVMLYLPYIKSVRYFHKVVYIYRLNNCGQSVSVQGIKKHYEDSKKVLLKLLDISSKNNNEIYKYQIAQFGKKTVGNYIIGTSIKSVRKAVKELDKYIKEKDYVVYNMMKNKSIILLRKTNYISVWFEKIYIYMRNLK